VYASCNNNDITKSGISNNSIRMYSIHYSTPCFVAILASTARNWGMISGNVGSGGKSAIIDS
jgi:hypothetical protein